jgi:hypothetical protein
MEVDHILGSVAYEFVETREHYLKACDAIRDFKIITVDTEVILIMILLKF